MRTRKRKTVNTRLHRVYLWLWDGMYGRLQDDAPDWKFGLLNRFVENPGCWLLCKMYGHEPVSDQCGIPEHDFCGWCNRPMPNSATVTDLL